MTTQQTFNKTFCFQWEHPTKPNTVKLNIEAFYQQSAAEQSDWVKKHYKWKVTCLCQSNRDIPLVLSNTGTRNPEKQPTYFVRNKDGFHLKHHERCPFYDLESAQTQQNQWQPNKQDQLVMALTGFDRFFNRKETTSSDATYLPPGLKGASRKVAQRSLSTFSREWLLSSLSLATGKAINQQKKPPHWHAIFDAQRYLLKQMQHAIPYQGQDLSLEDFYLDVPYPKFFATRTNGLREKYGAGVESFPFIISGRVLDITEPAEAHNKDFLIVKLQTKLTSGISYVWLSKKEHGTLFKTQTSLSTLAYQKGLVWLTAYLSQDKPKRQTTLNQGNKKMTLTLPQCECSTITPLALNGWVVENEHELTCFNQIANQQRFMKKPCLSDKIIPLKLPKEVSLPSGVFFFLSPEKGLKWTSRFLPAYVFNPKKQKNDPTSNEQAFLNHLETLSKHSETIWIWNVSTHPQLPGLPNPNKKRNP